MLYRAAGDDMEHLVYLGKAESTDGIHFERVSNEPAFAPGKNSFDAGSNEDPRIVKMGTEFFITYAFRPYFAGQYWKNEYDKVDAPDYDPNAPKCLRENISNTALAVSKDMRHFKKVGRLTEPSLDDRDVILFPEKINGKYWMLHRPKDYVNANGDYGTDNPSIWIKSSDDLMMWHTDSKLLMKGEEDWEVKIGGNTPPIKTDEGWFLLYHGVDKNFTYRIGAAILDLDDPTKVLYRTKDFILEPETYEETQGLYRWGGLYFLPEPWSRMVFLSRHSLQRYLQPRRVCPDGSQLGIFRTALVSRTAGVGLGDGAAASPSARSDVGSVGGERVVPEYAPLAAIRCEAQYRQCAGGEP